MDREFAFYLIELLDERLPLHGVWGTLNFDDRVPLGTYHINGSLQLVIPLMISLGEREKVYIEEAGLVDMLDEEDAIEHVMRWCESWQRAMYIATPEECRALAGLEDISAIDAHTHPLSSSLTRLAQARAHQHKLDAFLAGWSAASRRQIDSRAAQLIAQEWLAHDLLIPMALSACTSPEEFERAILTHIES